MNRAQHTMAVAPFSPPGGGGSRARTPKTELVAAGQRVVMIPRAQDTGPVKLNLNLPNVMHTQIGHELKV